VREGRGEWEAPDTSTLHKIIVDKALGQRLSLRVAGESINSMLFCRWQRQSLQFAGELAAHVLGEFVGDNVADSVQVLPESTRSVQLQLETSASVCWSGVSG